MQNGFYIKSQVNKALISLADGEKEALAVIYDLLGKHIYLMAFSVLRNKSDSEDVLQDTLVTVSQKAELYRKGENGAAWVLTIAKNLALDRIRKPNSVPLEHIEYSEYYAVTDEEYLQSVMLTEALNTLDDTDRLIVGMKGYSGYTLREISKILQLPLSTVEKRYQRAKVKLQLYLNGGKS